jgi:hypothetical protein
MMVRGLPGVKLTSLTPWGGSPGSREVVENYASRHSTLARFSMVTKASRARDLGSLYR